MAKATTKAPAQEESKFRCEVDNWFLNVYSDKGITVRVPLRAEGELIDQIFEFNLSTNNPVGQDRLLALVVNEGIRSELRKLYADEYLQALQAWTEAFSQRLLPSAMVAEGHKSAAGE